MISASGVQKILGRHGLGRRRQRVAALAQLTAATTGLVTDDARDGPFGFCHFAARPGDLVALDSFYIGNLKGVGKVWQLTAVDTATRWAICHVFLGPSNTDIAQRFLDRVIRKLRRLGVTRHRGAHRQRSRVQRPVRRPSRAARRSRITGPHPGPRTTTRCVNGSKAPRCRNAGDPRSTDDASTVSGNSAPRSTPGSSTTTPADRITATSCAGRTPRQVLDNHRKNQAS